MYQRRATGGKKKALRKKRKYELLTQSSQATYFEERVRGGNLSDLFFSSIRRCISCLLYLCRPLCCCCATLWKIYVRWSMLYELLTRSSQATDFEEGYCSWWQSIGSVLIFYMEVYFLPFIFVLHSLLLLCQIYVPWLMLSSFNFFSFRDWVALEES